MAADSKIGQKLSGLVVVQTRDVILYARCAESRTPPSFFLQKGCTEYINDSCGLVGVCPAMHHIRRQTPKLWPSLSEKVRRLRRSWKRYMGIL